MTLMQGNTLHQGRYVIEARLGQGGMGTVYLAADKNLRNMKVAIKENAEVSKATQEQFRREAEMLAHLQHPNLPRVSNYFIESSGRQYLVMDYIDGQTLREILSRSTSPLAETDVTRWLDQILDTLDYMHTWVDPATGQRQPIIHRDIKPDNIKIASSGSLYLVDFGIAKVVSGEATMVSQRAYSRGFSPIEQYTGGTDARSDIYSLGATLYSLLTRKLPPEAPLIAAGTATLASPRVFNPQISGNMEKVILRAMNLTPATRYQSVAEMRQALASRWPEIRLPTPRLPAMSAASPADAPAQFQTGTHLATAVAPKWRLKWWMNRQRIGVLLLVGIVVTLGVGWWLVSNATRADPGALSLPTRQVEILATPTELTPPAIRVAASTPATVQPAALAPTTPALEIATVPPQQSPLPDTDEATATLATATSTATPTDSATQTPTEGPTPLPTLTATATQLIVTRMPIVATPSATPTRVEPTSTATTVTEPTATRPAPPTAAPVQDNAFVSLIEPLENPLSGRRIFRWSTNVTLDANQAFELIFWPDGGDPMVDGFGPVGVTTSTQIEVNLDKSIDILPQLQAGRAYRWGVLLVTQSPYVRIQYLGGTHLFRVESAGGGGGSPTPTPRG